MLGRTLGVLLIAGCATTVPYTGQGPHPQLERGAPFPPVDVLGNVLSLPAKLILWSWKFNLHTISPETEAELVEYLGRRDRPAFRDAKYRLNQYRPLQDLSRLLRNRHAAWPYRLLLGLPTTLLGDVLLPGRLFPWGDHYNPFTNTVHLYSDHPAIALHEAGHVYDFSTKRHKGTYATLRLIPFVDLYQEFRATDEALDHFIATGDRANELAAYKILYPAYGSYMGRYLVWPFGYLPILAGHVYGRSVARQRERRAPAPAAPDASEPIPAAARPVPAAEPSAAAPAAPVPAPEAAPAP